VTNGLEQWGPQQPASSSREIGTLAGSADDDAEFRGNRPRDRLAAWIVRQPLGVTIALATLIVVVRYGVGACPIWTYMLGIAQHWTDPESDPMLRGSASYLLSSPTSALVAGIFHLRSPRTFLWFHLALAWVATFAPCFLPRVRRNAHLRTVVLLLTVGGAVSAVLFSWIGSMDPVSMGAAAVAGLAESPISAGVAWAIFAFNNGAEAFFALVAFAAVVWFGQHPRWPRLIASGAGVLIGVVAIHELVKSWGGGLSLIGAYGNWPLSRFTSSALQYWPFIAYGALGSGWFLLTSRGWFQRQQVRVFCTVAVLAIAGLPFVVLDQTRIVSGVLWASLLYVAAEGLIDIGAIRRLLIPSLFVPIGWVWADTIVFPGWNGAYEFFRSLIG
jgi:hypothetical protein